MISGLLGMRRILAILFAIIRSLCYDLQTIFLCQLPGSEIACRDSGNNILKVKISSSTGKKRWQDFRSNFLILPFF